MRPHEWEYAGPVVDGDPSGRRTWRCRRCGTLLGSDREPVTDGPTPFTAVFIGRDWKPSGVRSDCSLVLIRGVMES